MNKRAHALLVAALAGCSLPHAGFRGDDAALGADRAEPQDARPEQDATAMDAADDRPTRDAAAPDSDAAADAMDAAPIDAMDAAPASDAMDAAPTDTIVIDAIPDTVTRDSGAGDAMADGGAPDAGPPAIAIYNRPNGMLRFVANNGGRFRNGPFNGRSTATQVVASNFLGAGEARIFVIDASGSLQRYFVPTDMNDQLDYDGQDNRSTLNGNALNGGELRVVAPGVPQLLGSTDLRLVYTAMVPSGSASVRRVIQYAADWNHDFRFLESWATFTGGGLDAQVPSREIGLHDFAGNVDLCNNYWINIEGDGTFEFYWLGTGTRDNGLSNGSLGNWSSLRGGPLDNLSLSDLNRAPSGVYNSVSYRYFGTSNDDMVFELSSP